MFFTSKIKLNIELIITILLFLLLSCIGLSIDTTGDSGDSIMHFLYSKYSFTYPEYFLNHWAKPIFVLLSSPFSQFGFKGIIVFNCLVVSLTGLFAYRTARNLNLKYPWLVFVFILFSPLYFKLIFSGLTEYLFGLNLIITVYLATKKKYFTAVIIASFLPFIRSEGLIIVCVFGLFLILNKMNKLLPFLLTGHLFYSIVGYFYYKDIFWVFTKIPYLNLGSPYGSGKLFDFVHRLNYVIEKPIYLLLFIGFISLFWGFIKLRTPKFNSVAVILVYGMFLAFFIAHSLFWWLGIFNSMGLPRVLIPIVPLVAIIALIGLNFILNIVVSSKIRSIILILVVIVIISYPFTVREEGVVFNSNLFNVPENELIETEVTPYLRQTIVNIDEQLFYYSQCFLSISLDIDHFNDSRHREMNRLLKETPPKGAIVIWDDWFSVVEGGISLGQLKSNKNLKLLKDFKKQDKNRIIEYVILISTADN
jgi:hypothetical protein